MLWLKLWPQMVRSTAAMSLSDAEFRAYIGILLMQSESETPDDIPETLLQLLPDFIGIKDDKLRLELRNGDVTVMRNALVTARNTWPIFQSTSPDRQKRYRERKKKEVEDRRKKRDGKKDQDTLPELLPATSGGAERDGSNGKVKSVGSEDLDPERWDNVMAALNACSCDKLRNAKVLRSLHWWDAQGRAHPHADLDPVVEIAKMDAWLIANPRHYSRWDRFVSGWLTRAERDLP